MKLILYIGCTLSMTVSAIAFPLANSTIVWIALSLSIIIMVKKIKPSHKLFLGVLLAGVTLFGLKLYEFVSFCLLGHTNNLCSLEEDIFIHESLLVIAVLGLVANGLILAGSFKIKKAS